MITYQDIEVSFGDFVAVPRLDLTIEEGEFFTLLGPSGCGKTTILRTLAGFVTPSRGSIIIDGRDVTTLPSDKRDIGMVFQNYALFPSLTVRENIAFGLKVAKRPKAEINERVTAIAREVELTDAQLDRSVAELSGGQQQRVAIARAMIMRPKILLLDEPLSNLDAKLRQQMRVQLKDMQKHFGITTVYVTHDQDEALSLSDRIAVLNKGSIEQCDVPTEIYANSATEFVCTFIGDANRLEARVTQRLIDGGAHLDPHLPTFVRIEKLRVTSPDAPVPPGYHAVEGVVALVHYHGINRTYEVDLGRTRVRAILAEDGTNPQFGPGDTVRILTRHEHMLQYAEDGSATRVTA